MAGAYIPLICVNRWDRLSLVPKPRPKIPIFGDEARTGWAQRVHVMEGRGHGGEREFWNHCHPGMEMD